MSTSTTYRPIELTAEERAELDRKAHASQLAEEILPQLRSRWETQLLRAQVSLGERSAIGLERINELQQSLRDAGSIEEIRSTAAAIMGFEQGSLSRGETRLPAAPGLSRRECSGPAVDLERSDSANVLIDIELVDVELAVLARAASDLGIAPDALVVSQRSVEESRSLQAGGLLTEAATRLAQATESLHRLRTEVDEARAATECQERTATTVAATLTRLGFDVSRSTSGRTVNISAHAADGREADVEIAGGHGAGISMTLDVEDPASSVPDGDPAASDVCVGAATVGVEVHRDLGKEGGLAAGQVTAAGRPTRGRSSATAKKRRRTTNTNTNQRTRGLP